MSQETRAGGTRVRRAAAITDETEPQDTRRPAAEPAPSAGIASGATETELQNAAPAPRAEAPAPSSSQKLKTRRSRRDGQLNEFDIPAKYRKAGFDYEWKTTRVMGQDVDSADMAFYRDQGWEPVEAKEMPDLLAPGSTARYIERRGQIMMLRPMYLTEQARREDYEIAETQKMDKLQSASAVSMPRPGLMNALKPEVKIEGEVGSHAPRSPAQ